MTIFDAIRVRRSVRDYRKELPPDRDIEKILESGRWAPSGLNNQPWRFMVIRAGAFKEALVGMTTSGKIIRKAPVLMAVFLDLGESYHRDKDLTAIGACIQNMLLQAQELELGTCWLGEILNRKEEVRDLLKVDRRLELMAVIALGYPKGPAPRSNRKPLKKILIEE